MTDILFDSKIKFDGQPIVTDLLCFRCQSVYGGVWRNDWLMKRCRKCNVLSVIKLKFEIDSSMKYLIKSSVN